MCVKLASDVSRHLSDFCYIFVSRKGVVQMNAELLLNDYYFMIEYLISIVNCNKNIVLIT